MMCKPFILLLGIFLGSYRPVIAQTLAPRIVLAQKPVAPIITILPTVSTALPAVSSLSQGLEKSNAHFSLRFAGAYQPNYTQDHLSPMDEG